MFEVNIGEILSIYYFASQMAVTLQCSSRSKPEARGFIQCSTCMDVAQTLGPSYAALPGTLKERRIGGVAAGTKKPVSIGDVGIVSGGLIICATRPAPNQCVHIPSHTWLLSQSITSLVSSVTWSFNPLKVPGINSWKNANADKITLFKKAYFYWEGRFTGETEDLPSASSLPKWLQRTELSFSKTMNFF